MTATLRRRADKVVLRWQARLDGEWADRVLPWILAAGLLVLLAAMALAKVRSLDTAPEFAAANQAVWLLEQRLPPNVTLADGGNVFAEQASFVYLPVAGLALVVPIPALLVLLQSGALAVTIVPVWRVARDLARLRVAAAAAVVAAYALYPTMHNLNLSGFFPDALALPLLVWAFLFGLGKHWRRFIACCLAVVLCRADLGLVVAGLGGLLWWEGRRRDERVLSLEGKGALLGGLAYTVVAVTVVQPILGDGSYPHLSAFSEFGDTTLSVLGGMVSRPGDVIGALVAETNFDLLVTLFAPVAFLPFLAPRYLIPAVPLQFFFLVGTVERTALFGQLTVPMTACVFVATAFALARIGRMGVERVVVDRRLLYALLLASTLFFVRDAASSPYRAPWDWGGRDAADPARLAAADRVTADAAVRVSPSLAAEFAERPVVHLLPSGSPPDARRAAEGVDVVVVDRDAVGEWNPVDQRVFSSTLSSLGLEQVSDEAGILVFRRPSVAADAPPSG